MKVDKRSGTVWVVVAIIYGFGMTMFDNIWFTIGGATFIALLAVTSSIWSKWLGESDEV